WDSWSANLVGRDEPERVEGAYVSPEFFAVVGVAPALGRAFVRDEETMGRHTRVILSDTLWKRRFGGDPDIVGQSIFVDGSQSIVVGVMPRDFAFPRGAELWAPLAFDAKTADNRGSRYLTVFARLASGGTLQQAQAELSVVGDRLAHEYPKTNAGHRVVVYSLENGMRDLGLWSVLSLWQAGAVIVLLITC